MILLERHEKQFCATKEQKLDWSPYEIHGNAVLSMQQSASYEIAQKYLAGVNS